MSAPTRGVGLVLDFVEGALRKGEPAVDVAVVLAMFAGFAELLNQEKLREFQRHLRDEPEARHLISAVIAGAVTAEELAGVGRSLRVPSENAWGLLSEVWPESVAHTRPS